MYAIVDIETTGARPGSDRITEVAVVLFDGEKIVDSYQSLVNPECSIPPNITQITGITNQMVANAPKFFEIAKAVVEITKKAIFVAHNVGFDYGFIREEFARLGYSYRRKQLCTVRLSKLVFPGRRRYNLDSMIDMLGIEVARRHRAMDDVAATVKLLEAILAQQTAEESIANLVNRGVNASKLPPNFTMEQLHALPEDCGIYYFHNQNNEVIYVGKSINIKKRIMEHFAAKTAKAQKMQRDVHDITFEVTGSELAALLLESHEIKTLLPRYNTAQKPQKKSYCIFKYQDEDGYQRLAVARTQKDLDVVFEYKRREEAVGTLRTLQAKFELCQHKCDLGGSPKGACFHYHIKQCLGACIGEESPEGYNERAEAAIIRVQCPELEGNFVLMEMARHKTEQAVIVIENGYYQGFGYVDTTESLTTEDLLESITNYEHNFDVVQIIMQHAKNNRLKRVGF
jgi:DNA polymerase-3 subunit epsilon